MFSPAHPCMLLMPVAISFQGKCLYYEVKVELCILKFYKPVGCKKKKVVEICDKVPESH